jgi:mRNA guanylyltransferase
MPSIAPAPAPVHAPPPPAVPGHLLSNEEAQPLKEDVQDILQRESSRFPGAQPVSFALNHLAELRQREYFLCEKTDGLRCLLFLSYMDTAEGFVPLTFLIDRKNNYHNVQPALRIPYFSQPDNPGAFLFGTILDGELVHDQYPTESAPRLNFYIFDCLAGDRLNLTTKTLDKRLGWFKQNVLGPYHKKLMATSNPDLRPFALKEKLFRSSYSIGEMFQNVLPTLKHGNDGLIFTCKDTPYVHGTDRHILKWKPPHENTIDFKLKLDPFPLFDPADGEDGLIYDYDAMPTSFELHVMHDRHDYRKFANLAVTPAEWEILRSLDERLDGRIIECYRTPAGQWKYKAEGDGSPRWRDDKKDANHISTVHSVLESIENPVTQELLLANEEDIKKAMYKRQGKPYPPVPAHGERDAKKRRYDETGIDGENKAH